MPTPDELKMMQEKLRVLAGDKAIVADAGSLFDPEKLKSHAADVMKEAPAVEPSSKFHPVAPDPFAQVRDAQVYELRAREALWDVLRSLVEDVREYIAIALPSFKEEFEEKPSQE